MSEPRAVKERPRRHVGRRVLLYDEVASTNDVARERKAPGEAIVAMSQTHGRGQHGRQWLSRPGDSLLLSVTVDPPEHLRRPPILIAWAAVAVSDAVKSLTDLRPRIKWPNDLLLHEKKICGILTELHGAAVIGIGLNLNQSTDDFAVMGLPEAGSLRSLGGSVYPFETVLESVLGFLDTIYDQLIHKPLTMLEKRWAEYFNLVERKVRLELLDGSILTGLLTGMSFQQIRITKDGTAIEIKPERIRQMYAL